MIRQFPTFTPNRTRCTLTAHGSSIRLCKRKGRSAKTFEFMGVFITLLLSLIFFHVDGELGITQHLRRLISSNCVMIERGGMPPYRKCGMTQCIIQNAIACISDLRHNRSGNIAPDCQIGSLYNRRQNYGKDVVVDYNPSRDPPYEFGTKDPNTGEFVADPRLGIKELTVC
jgi:hypothetical protein